MSTLLHSPSKGRGETKLKKALDYIPKNAYDYILLDNIPCYGLSYAITSVSASDINIVPLRLTKNDLGRTMWMIKTLQETMVGYDIEQDEFEKRLFFLFNQIATK